MLLFILFRVEAVEPVLPNTTVCKEIGHPSELVNLYIQRYADLYGVPQNYIYRCLLLETGYKGPKHVAYNPYQVSDKNAFGPMQVRIIAARDTWDLEHISDKDLQYFLRHDIEFNIRTGIAYLKKQHRVAGNYANAFAVYNRGIKGFDSVNTYAKTITGE